LELDDARTVRQVLVDEAVAILGQPGANAVASGEAGIERGDGLARHLELALQRCARRTARGREPQRHDREGAQADRCTAPRSAGRTPGVRSLAGEKLGSRALDGSAPPSSKTAGGRDGLHAAEPYEPRSLAPAPSDSQVDARAGGAQG